MGHLCENRHFLKMRLFLLKDLHLFMFYYHIFYHYNNYLSLYGFFLQFSYSEFSSHHFHTSGSMIPRLVPEISPLDAFCDGEEEQELGILGSSSIWCTPDNFLRFTPDTFEHIKR